jgi:protein phosphatase
MVQVLYNTGVIDADQRATHPFRNVLYQAVGTTEDVKPDIYSVHADDESYLLLCSDGLTNELDDEAIYTIVMQVDSPQAACDRLVDQANQRGGHDNISVLIVTLHSDEQF